MTKKNVSNIPIQSINRIFITFEVSKHSSLTFHVEVDVTVSFIWKEMLLRANNCLQTGSVDEVVLLLMAVECDFTTTAQEKLFRRHQSIIRKLVLWFVWLLAASFPKWRAPQILSKLSLCNRKGSKGKGINFNRFSLQIKTHWKEEHKNVWAWQT